MDAIEFLKTWDRLCNIKTCRNCPLNFERNKYYLSCNEFCKTHPDEAVKIVEKWAAENPEKTRQDDFTEKFPKSSIDEDGNPDFCCLDLGYCSECPPDCDCTVCWHQPVNNP